MRSLCTPLLKASNSHAAPPLTAQTGTLNGTVLDAASSAPVRNVQVTLPGTSLATQTDEAGRFRIANVPASARDVTARRIGYKPQTVRFTMDASGAANVTIAITESAMTLDATVITGVTGDTRKRAIGNSVATVTAAEVVEQSAVENITEVLQAKTPGLTLMPGSGTVGTAANFRLRGAGSLYAGNSPTIYLDGVRVSQRSQGSFDTFGQVTSALDAINPSDIESIEVIKGPAASTLYGAEAAAGVIQIITKKGRAGPIRWRIRGENGNSEWDASLRPVNYAIATAARIADTVTWPGFKGKAVGDIISFRPMSDGRALRTGGLSKYSIEANGGGDRATFYISAAQDKEEGVYYNSFSDLNSARGNFSFLASNKLSFTANLGLSNNHIRLPLNDNVAAGMIISSYLAIPGRTYAFPAGPEYSTITPELANIYDNQTWANRFFSGGSAEYKPFEWLTNRIRLGLDVNVGTAQLYYAPDARVPYQARFSLDLDNSKGFIAEGRPLTTDATINYDATATRTLTSTITSNTSFGMQYLSNIYRRTEAIGLDLGAAGVRSVSSAAVTSSTERDTMQKSFGVYVQEQLGWRDRLFGTAGVRLCIPAFEGKHSEAAASCRVRDMTTRILPRRVPVRKSGRAYSATRNRMRCTKARSSSESERTPCASTFARTRSSSSTVSACSPSRGMASQSSVLHELASPTIADRSVRRYLLAADVWESHAQKSAPPAAPPSTPSPGMAPMPPKPKRQRKR